ncbi:MAG: hypothetical protein V7704_18005 [Aurantimonas endophytica]|uniref:hypothetical protein n=1 Tax=Aurantimonas endophytica TaxID=1522175 RepID=UPI003001FE12
MEAIQILTQQGLNGLTLLTSPTPVNPDRTDRSFPLAGIADAFWVWGSGSHFGKVVVEY